MEKEQSTQLNPLCVKHCSSLENCPFKDKHRFVVAHNGKDIYHAVEIDALQFVSTGQPFLEVFDTEKEALKKFPKVKFREEEEIEELEI